MNIYKNTAHSRGVSIVEALLAAVIVGVGFVSVYTMTTTSSRLTYMATQRDNDTHSASMIMDDIALDKFTVGDSSYNQSISVAQYHNLDLTQGCDAAGNIAANTRKFDRQRMRWCNFLSLNNGGMRVADTANGDARNIRVRDVTVTSNGYVQNYKVVIVNITHNTRGRNNQRKWYFKILHE